MFLLFSDLRDDIFWVKYGDGDKVGYFILAVVYSIMTLCVTYVSFFVSSFVNVARKHGYTIRLRLNANQPCSKIAFFFFVLTLVNYVSHSEYDGNDPVRFDSRNEEALILLFNNLPLFFCQGYIK